MPAKRRHQNRPKYYHEHKSKTYILISLLVILGIGWYLFLREYNAKMLNSFEVTKITYECPDNKSIMAAFSGNIVNVELSDGRNQVLNHPLMEDTKYTNKDGSLVFWVTGNEAFIKEGNGTTYQNCTKQ